MFIRCYFAIPARFRGERVRHLRRLGNHMVRVLFSRSTIKGEFDVPDWWIDNGMGMQPEVRR